jgi:BirA family transcriptional regulator, biotin operon repressor / biotin---[acetyl-CoA-carboxylase] ligase
MTGDLTEDALQRALAGRRLGTPRRLFASIGSTNAEAIAWAAAGAPEGALVVTDHQTAGRGRWGRTWFSEPGSSLMFSIVLRPRIDPSTAGLLTTALGVAVADGVEAATGLPARVTWPNDVMVTGRKLAGILVETRLAGTTLDFAVAGVGLNVSWDADQLPDELLGRATSLRVEADRGGAAGVPGRAELLASVLGALEDVYPLPTGDSRRAALIRRATVRSEVLGKQVRIRFSDGRRIEGTARALTLDGGLTVESPHGRFEVTGGEIERLRTLPS